MPMIDIQRRHAEVFRVRLGEKGPNGAPRKLTDSIRITARNRSVVEAFTEVYGGDVEPWDSQWQAYLPTTELRILVLPGQSVQQWWEFYRGSVCERRCDGYMEQKSGRRCVCPEDIDERMKDRNACSPTTRVSVLCPDVNVIGAGTLVTHGLIAAETLPQSIAVAEAALARGYMVPAVLRVVEHKGRTHFIVPQIEIVGVSLQALTSGEIPNALPKATDPRPIAQGEVMAGTSFKALEPPPERLLEPVPQSVEQTPVPSVAEQATTFPERKKRSNAAPPIPDTGVEPRTVDEVAEPAVSREDLEAELMTLLGPDPDPKATIAVLEADVRRVYRLMDALEFPGWRGDALHTVLRKHFGAEHVGDLKKAELVDFCQRTWEAARKAVLERPFGEEQ